MKRVITHKGRKELKDKSYPDFFKRSYKKNYKVHSHGLLMLSEPCWKKTTDPKRIEISFFSPLMSN